MSKRAETVYYVSPTVSGTPHGPATAAEVSRLMQSAFVTPEAIAVEEGSGRSVKVRELVQNPKAGSGQGASAPKPANGLVFPSLVGIAFAAALGYAWTLLRRPEPTPKPSQAPSASPPPGLTAIALRVDRQGDPVLVPADGKTPEAIGPGGSLQLKLSFSAPLGNTIRPPKDDPASLVRRATGRVRIEIWSPPGRPKLQVSGNSLDLYLRVIPHEHYGPHRAHLAFHALVGNRVIEPAKDIDEMWDVARPLRRELRPNAVVTSRMVRPQSLSITPTTPRKSVGRVVPSHVVSSEGN